MLAVKYDSITSGYNMKVDYKTTKKPRQKILSQISPGLPSLVLRLFNMLYHIVELGPAMQCEHGVPSPSSLLIETIRSHHMAGSNSAR